MRFFLILFISILTFRAPASEIDKIIVYKKKHRMIFYSQGKIVKSYKVMLGRGGMGPKKQEGDRLVPEGDYILDYKNPTSKFYKSIHVSYPNAIDIERAKKDGVNPGGDIMIHGMPNLKIGFESWMYELDNNFLDFISGNIIQSFAIDWTAGCIAVKNSSMTEIYNIINVPVSISIYH